LPAELLVWKVLLDENKLFCAFNGQAVVSLSEELAPQEPVALTSTTGREHAKQPHSYRSQGWKG
jgi:hypothetical protein